ncbi:MAG: CHAT domain-containing protein, partial [Mycobacteriales bacterium]
MILGAYSTRAGGGARPLPRIVQLSIRPLSARRFRVGIHEEGSGYSFTQDVAMAAAVEVRLLALVADLHSWSLGQRLTKRAALAAATELGRTLDRVFLGRNGGAVLAGLEPKVLLVDVDETMLGLPWELLQSARRDWSNDIRFGRIVATSVPPRRHRDPRTDDPVVKILVVANPTDDLAATSAELAVISGLAGQRANCTVEVQVLEGKQATRAGLAAAVKDADHDIVHFAGHA